MNYFDSNMPKSTNTVVYFDWKTAIYIYVCGQCRTQFAKFEQTIIHQHVHSRRESQSHELPFTSKYHPTHKKKITKCQWESCPLCIFVAQNFDKQVMEVNRTLQVFAIIHTTQIQAWCY
jgi:hypothetical protein